MAAQNMILQKLGGAYQLVIDTPEQLELVQELNDAHWMVTSASCESFICDADFLRYLDTDGNKSIRSDEVREHLKWTLKVLADRSGMNRQNTTLRLTAVDTSHDEGKAIQAAAERVLGNLGVTDTDTISLEQVKSRKQILSAGACNGDGVIPVNAAPDDVARTLIESIVKITGGSDDASGEKGVNAEQLDNFLAAAKGYLEWKDKGKVPENDQEQSAIMIWGDETPDVYAKFKAVEKKLEEFFCQCQLLSLDEKASARYTVSDDALNGLDLTDPAAISSCMATQAIAKPVAEEILDLDAPINPVFRKPFGEFCQSVLKRFKADSTALDLDTWQQIKDKLSAYNAWWEAKPEGPINELDEQLLRELIEPEAPAVANLRDLIKQDADLADEVKQIDNVEKLILCQQWLLELVNNFVSLKRLFDPKAESLLQVGTLVMDGRCFDLTTKVINRGEHKKVAERSNICIMYLEISRKEGDKETKMEVATAVTSGFITNLYVGKHGVFFTPDGKEWDAKMVDFIQQPVSLSEALRMPFKKLGEFVNKQIDKFTSSRYKDLESGVGKGISQAEQSLQKGGKSGGVPWGGMSFMMLGGGISLAALGSAFAYVTKTLKSVSVVNVLLVLGLLILVVAAPIVIVAIIKLRKRNIAMFLEAGDWSVNAQLRLSRKMGLLFTHEPAYPKTAEKRRFDMVRPLLSQLDIQQSSRRVWITWILVIILIGTGIGYLIRSFLSVDERVAENLGIHMETVTEVAP